MDEDRWNAMDELLKSLAGKKKLKAFAEFLIKRNI